MYTLVSLQDHSRALSIHIKKTTCEILPRYDRSDTHKFDASHKTLLNARVFVFADDNTSSFSAARAREEKKI